MDLSSAHFWSVFPQLVYLGGIAISYYVYFRFIVPKIFGGKDNLDNVEYLKANGRKCIWFVFVPVFLLVPFVEEFS